MITGLVDYKTPTQTVPTITRITEEKPFSFAQTLVEEITPKELVSQILKKGNRE